MSHHEKKHYDRNEEQAERKAAEPLEEEEISAEPDEVDKMTEAEAKENLRKANSEVSKLREEIEKLKKENEEAKNDYLRARADCENVRKHKNEEVRAAYDDGRVTTVDKLLILTGILIHTGGIEKLLKKYHETLSALGVIEFSPEAGSKFDPNVANAVMTVPKESESDEPETIKQVYGRGYKLGEKIMRYAQVSVIKE